MAKLFEPTQITMVQVLANKKHQCEGVVMILYEVAPKNMSGHKMTFSTKPKEVLFCFGAWCFFGAEKSGKHGVETHGYFRAG